LNRLRRQVSFDRLLARLLTTYSIAIPQWPPTIPSPAKVAESMQVDREERARKRIALFPSLFHGREDVYARRWESAGGHSGYSPAAIKNWKAINESRPEERRKVDQKTRKFLPQPQPLSKRSAGSGFSELRAWGTSRFAMAPHFVYR
jgi:hypothetical protein